MNEIKNKLIITTIEEFEKNGLNITLDGILASSNISEDEFNNAFSSFEDLLVASLEEGFTLLQKEKTEFLNSDLSTIDKLKAILTALPEQYKMIDYSKLKNVESIYPKAYQTLMENLRADWEPIVEMLNEAIINEEIKPISIPLFQAIYTSAIETLMGSDVLAEIQMPYHIALEQLGIILIDGIANKE